MSGKVIVLVARLVALFVIVGGAIGTLIAWIAISFISVLSTEQPISLEIDWFVQFLTLLPFVLLVGIALSAIPATATAWFNLSVPQSWRTYVNAALVGVATSVLIGCYITFLLWEGSRNVQDLLSVLAVFGASGAAAATTCHSFAKRWPEFASSSDSGD